MTHLTTKDAAEVIGARLGRPVSDRLLRIWIKQGQLAAERHGRDWFIAEADAAAFTPRDNRRKETRG